MTEQVIKLKAQLEAKEEMILFLKDIIQVLKIQLEKQANPLMGVAPYRPHYDTFPYKVDHTVWPPLDTFTTTNKITIRDEYSNTSISSKGTYIVSGSTGPYLSNCAEPYWKN